MTTGSMWRGLALVLVLAVPCCRSGIQTRFAPPRLEIEPRGRVDLGELGPREIRIQGYRLRNTSDAPISLRVLDLAPGVTVAGPALEQPIPAAAARGLELRVDPQGWAGPQARNVRLGTDDPGQGDYYLPIRMRVRPDLTVDGTRRSFGDVAAFESPAVLFSFVRETGEPLALRLVTGLPDYLECELQVLGPRAQLGFTLRPARIPPGMRLGLDRVRVESNAPLQPRFDLYLEWRVHHAIEANPPRLLFPDPGPDTLVLELRSRSGVPFRILGAALEGDGFQLGPLPAPAPVQRLRVRRGATAARAMLVLRVAGQAEPLRVPVAYLPAAVSGDEGVMVVPHKSD
jgi:hypothetical protein